jgi:hypothetical protein
VEPPTVKVYQPAMSKDECTEPQKQYNVVDDGAPEQGIFYKINIHDRLL